MEKKKVFRSRISVLLIGIMLITFIPIFMMAIPPLIQFEDYKMLWILGLILLPVILVFTGIRYIILGDKLLIKIWIIPMWSINIADIVSAERSHNVLSSPAASLKRLKVTLRRGGKKFSRILISPVRELEFIAALQAINPFFSIRIADSKAMWRIWDWDI
jgi:hypothetical protein